MIFVTFLKEYGILTATKEARMPSSTPRHMPTIVEQFWRLRPESILEIGPGFGMYGLLARQYLEIWCPTTPYGVRKVRVDACEVFGDYILDHHRAIYDNIYVDDGLCFVSGCEDKSYDLILILDVLEHFSREDGLRLLVEATRVAKHVIVNVPYPPGEQGAVFGNEHEAHVSSWEPSDFGPDAEIIEQTDALIVVL